MHKPLHRRENVMIPLAIALQMGWVQNASEYKENEQIVGNNLVGTPRTNDFSDSR